MVRSCTVGCKVNCDTLGGGWAAANAARAVRELESLDAVDRAAHDCVAQALEAIVHRVPAIMESSDAHELAPAKARLQAAGVLDATLLLSRELSIAWSHVRTIVQLSMGRRPRAPTSGTRTSGLSNKYHRDTTAQRSATKLYSYMTPYFRKASTALIPSCSAFRTSFSPLTFATPW